MYSLRVVFMDAPVEAIPTSRLRAAAWVRSRVPGAFPRRLLRCAVKTERRRRESPAVVVVLRVAVVLSGGGPEVGCPVVQAEREHAGSAGVDRDVALRGVVPDRVVVDQGVQLVVHRGGVPELVGDSGGSFKRHCSVLPFVSGGPATAPMRSRRGCGREVTFPAVPFHSAQRGATVSSRFRIVARETHHSRAASRRGCGGGTGPPPGPPHPDWVSDGLLVSSRWILVRALFSISVGM